MDDALPTGASAQGTWTWVSSVTGPVAASGSYSHKGVGNQAAYSQHYFEFASSNQLIGYGDTLTTYVYIPSGLAPYMIMLQWKSAGSWEHRAYWSATSVMGNVFPYGTLNTASKRRIGGIPSTRGAWVKLEVPASSVGLEGQVIDGMAYTQLGGTLYWDRSGVRAAARGEQANFVSQSVGATTISAGTQRTVTVTMRNTGSTTWTTAAGYKLGSQNPQDNTAWGFSRVALPKTIGPGLLSTFNFTIRAPTTPGTYNFQWKMVRELVAWLGYQSTNVPITVPVVLPAQPGSLSPASGASVPSTQTSVRLSWGAVGVATSYAIRATERNTATGQETTNRVTGNTCSVHYLCRDPLPVSPTYVDLPVRPGHSYVWWVHAINIAGWSGYTYTPFTVQAVPPKVWIQGVKLNQRGAVFNDANAIIDPLGATSTCGASTASQSASATACGSSINPYYASTEIVNNMATITSRIPASARNSLVAASVCNENGNYDCTNHPVSSYCRATVVGSYATLNLPMGTRKPGYIDVWWKYLPQGTEGLPRCDEEGAPRLTTAASFLSTVRGDVDGDGFVTITDGVNALRCAAGVSIPYACLPNADCDRDGQVTTTDGVHILRMAAELSSSCSGTTPPATNYQIGGGYRLRTDVSPPQCTMGNTLTNGCTCPEGYSAMPLGSARGDGFVMPHKGDYKDMLRESIELLTITTPIGAAWWMGKRIATDFHLFGMGLDGSPGSPGTIYMCTKPATTSQGFQGGFSVRADGPGGTQVNPLTGGYSCPPGMKQDEVGHVLGPGPSPNYLYACRNTSAGLAGADQSTYGGMYHQNANGQCIRGNVIGDTSLETSLILYIDRTDDPNGPGDPHVVSLRDATGEYCSCQAGYTPTPIANVSDWNGSSGVIWLCSSPPLVLPPAASDPNAGIIRGRVINSLTGEGIEAKVLLSRGRGFQTTKQTTNYSFEFSHLERALYYLYPIFPPGYERVRWSICYGGDTTCHSHPDVALYEPMRPYPEQYMPVYSGNVIDFLIRFKPID